MFEINDCSAFVYKTDQVATVALENYHTVHSDWYTTISLLDVIAELRKTAVIVG